MLILNISIFICIHKDKLIYIDNGCRNYYFDWNWLWMFNIWLLLFYKK